MHAINTPGKAVHSAYLPLFIHTNQHRSTNDEATGRQELITDSK